MPSSEQTHTMLKLSLALGVVQRNFYVDLAPNLKTGSEANSGPGKMAWG